MPISRRRPYAVTFGSAFRYAGRAIGLAAKYFRRNNGSRCRRGTVGSFLSTSDMEQEPPCDACKSLWIRGKREGNVTKSFNFKNMVDISHHLTIPVAPQCLLQNVLRTKHSYWSETKKKTMQFNIPRRVETNYHTETGNQKAFWWTEDKVIFTEPEKFFYRENFKRGLFGAFTSTTETIWWKWRSVPGSVSVDVNGLYWTTTFPTKNERMMLGSGSLSNITDGTNAIQNISKNGLLILLGMQPRNNKKISVWSSCLSLCIWKGSFLSHDLVWRYTVYHCITGEQC